MVQEVKIHSSPKLEMKVIGKALYSFLQGKWTCLAETAVKLAVHTPLPHSAVSVLKRGCGNQLVYLCQALHSEAWQIHQFCRALNILIQIYSILSSRMSYIVGTGYRHEFVLLWLLYWSEVVLLCWIILVHQQRLYHSFKYSVWIPTSGEVLLNYFLIYCLFSSHFSSIFSNLSSSASSWLFSSLFQLWFPLKKLPGTQCLAVLNAMVNKASAPASGTW